MDYKEMEVIGIFVLLAVGLLGGLIICIFQETKGSRIYKKIQKPIKTVGTVTKVEVDPGSVEPYHPTEYTFYYTFQDEWGRVCQGKYPRSRKELYHKGDSIFVYYDAIDSQRNMAEAHLEFAKAAYWKVPLQFVLIIGGCFALPLLAILLGKVYRYLQGVFR